jgi:hypothetical protein
MTDALQDVLRELDGDAAAENEGNRLECLLSALSTYDEETDTDPQLSVESLEEMAILLRGSTESSSAGETDLHENWRNAISFLRTRVLPTLSPLELHSTVVQSILWENNRDSQQDDDCLPSSRPRTYTMLCLLLCCHALQQCPAAQLLKRRQRWRSVLWESLRLFQRYSSCAPSSQSPLVF